MKKILYRLLIILIPIISYLTIYEYLYRRIPNDYSYKYKYLSNIEKASKIQVLVLGTSHTYKGVNPNLFKHNVFSGACDSQPLYYDYHLLHHFLIDNPTLVKLKYVILAYDYVTLSNYQDITTLRKQNYYIYWKFDYMNSLRWYEKLKCLNSNFNIIRYYLLNYNLKQCDDLGWDYHWSDTINPLYLEANAIGAIKTSTNEDINSKLFQNNKHYLKGIIKDCNKKGVILLLLNTPKTPEFIANLYKPQMKSTNDYVNLLVHEYKNIKYLNWQTCDDFNLNYFKDSHHLNSAGASKLSIKLDSLLFKLDSTNL